MKIERVSSLRNQIRSVVGARRGKERLAILGGEPTRERFLAFGSPSIGEEEINEVVETLRSGWIGTGPRAERFEAEFADYVGARHAVALNSCTAGLFLSLRVLGVGPGDAVITTPLTFAATANVIEHVGARPVFADIDAASLNIDPKRVEEAIRRCIDGRSLNRRYEPKAIMPVHFGGLPCDMHELRSIADGYNLEIIEDAAHAVGAKYQDQKVGSISRLTCFSFYANKNLVTGEGGMVVTDDGDIAARLRLLRSHGMTTMTWDRHRGHAYTYDVIALGYNYRLDEMRAALGIAQLRKLDEFNARRRLICERYEHLLGEVHEVKVPYPDHPGVSAAHIRPVLLDPEVNRDAVMAHLQLKGIQTSIHYPPIHRFSFFAERISAGDLRVTEQVASREITLPLYPSMSSTQLEQVVRGVKGALARRIHPRPAWGP